jgi:hypothetical protein
MTRYHMFQFDIDTGDSCIDLYSTDMGLLAFLAGDMPARFGASEVESGEVEQTGGMSVYFESHFDFRLAEHYFNQLLCGNGWEPYDEGRFKLRYEG